MSKNINVLFTLISHYIQCSSPLILITRFFHYFIYYTMNADQHDVSLRIVENDACGQNLQFAICHLQSAIFILTYYNSYTNFYTCLKVHNYIIDTPIYKKYHTISISRKPTPSRWQHSQIGSIHNRYLIGIRALRLLDLLWTKYKVWMKTFG